MLHDTQWENEAIKKAAKLGAVDEGIAFYPRRPDGSPSGSGVFAIYYFNAKGDEVGHFIPSLASFTRMDPPRVWADSVKQHLSVHAIRGIERGQHVNN
jgi:hypothetical protein